MNRRALLKFIGLAPVAVPIAAQVAADTRKPFLFGEGVYGEAIMTPKEFDAVLKVHAPSPDEIRSLVRDSATRAIRVCNRVGVEAQMREHNIFDLRESGDRVISTTVPHERSHLNPA